MQFFSIIGLVALLVTSLATFGCGDGEFELADPPDLRELGDRYERPTARFDADVAAAFIERYIERRKRLRRADDFKSLTDPLQDFSEATSQEEDGTLTIDGSPINVDAVITLSGRCRGWSDEPDERGTFDLRMTVRQTALVPVGWGDVDDCRGQHTLEGETLRYALSGALSVYIPSLVDSSYPGSLILSYEFSTFDINDDSFAPWEHSFRLIDNTVEMLFYTEDQASLVFSSDAQDTEIRVRAVNGTWLCNAQERQCESDDSPDASFSY